MQQHWLFALPRAGWDEQQRMLAEWLAADPAAAAVPDAEAELFCAAAHLVTSMDGNTFTKLCRGANVRTAHTGQKARRRATILVLRQWKNARFRELLVSLIPNCGMDSLPDVKTQPQAFTNERFANAYADGLHIMWLVCVWRYLHRGKGIRMWLKSLDSTAPSLYKLWLTVGRLTLRRIVYPGLGPDRAMLEATAAAQPELASELRTKDRQSGALRQDVRRLQQNRRTLKERARRAEQESRAQLTQARGEVDAARRALATQLAAQERELAERARRHEGELAALRARRAGAREELVRRLSTVVVHGPTDLLRGREIVVNGAEADREVHKLLVESLGGRLVPEGGTVVAAGSGFAQFDRQLRHLVLDRVLIKCDGLYRRKPGRAGIAISAFQVVAGDKAVFRSSGVVCCGPAAGSLMAEYGAVAMALSWLAAGNPPPGAKIEIWSDCKTMLSRLRQPVPVERTIGCMMLDRTIRRLVRVLDRRGCYVHLRWVPRDEVDTVDRLCDEAYRAQYWYHKPARRPRAPLRAFLGAVAACAPSRAVAATIPAQPALPRGVTAGPGPTPRRQAQL